jgi:hypothetical protein
MPTPRAQRKNRLRHYGPAMALSHSTKLAALVAADSDMQQHTPAQVGSALHLQQD